MTRFAPIDRPLRRRGGAALVLLALAWGVAPQVAIARKPRPVPCPDGVFTVAGAPFQTDAATTATQLVLSNGQLRLVGVCAAAVAARIQAGARATKITATFAPCDGRFTSAKLKAAIRAPACEAVKGVLTVKGVKPKRRPFTARRLPPAELVAALRTDDARARMANENFAYLMRPAAEAFNPEVGLLIAQGDAVVDALLAEFAGVATLPDDVPLSLLAYALERIGSPRAVPALTEWLERNLFSMVLFADDFVTHAIKVLAGHGGLDTEHFTYGIDEKLDTISRARSAAVAAATITAPPRAAATRPLPAASITDARNKCQKRITVVGINAAGQQETVPIDYTTVFYDLQEQIDLEDDPTKQGILARQRDSLHAADEEFYGSSDYRPIGEVSVKSNCGGSVTERLLNGVAAARGFPIRLGDGNAGADAIRDLARRFGTPIAGTEIDPFTVIAHERETGASAHVEIPLSVADDSAVVYSKDNQGRPRLHTVARGGLVGNLVNDFFDAVQQRYNFRPFHDYAQTTPRFYRLDPSRIVSITLDSSGCRCDFAFGGVVPVALTQPAEAEVTERVITVGGTIGDATVTDGMLRVNGSAQGLTLFPGGFSSQVVLRSGDNTIRVAVDAPDGRRGCTERTIKSTTPKTTISATLTWNLDDTDVDLYVTQADGETSYFSNRTTAIGGRLDVDNTQGHGPENYFLSAAEGDTVPAGDYVIRVHYYRDRQADAEHPVRAVTWRVVVLVNEGTPEERREILGGTLGEHGSSNSSPGASGPDWATATTVTIAAE